MADMDAPSGAVSGFDMLGVEQCNDRACPGRYELRRRMFDDVLDLA